MSTFNSAPENLRQAYLARMNIQAWYPKYLLANAKAPSLKPYAQNIAASGSCNQNSTQLEKPNSKKLASQALKGTPNQIQVPISAVKKVLQPPKTLMRTTTQLKTQTGAQANIKADTQQPSLQRLDSNGLSATAIDSSTFRLLIMDVSNTCLIITDMPYATGQPFDKYHRQLLNYLLKASHINETYTDTPKEFSWPLTHKTTGLLSTIKKNDAVAAQSVKIFLNSQFKFYKRRFVFLLGEASARFVLDTDKHFNDLRGLNKPTENQWIVVSYSLNQLMQYPLFKKHTWNDLAPLRSLTLK